MAKLDVKVIDMKDGEVTKISYEGGEYSKVDDGIPQKGDIGKFTNRTYAGAFTEIIDIDWEGDPKVCGEYGGNWFKDHLEYFRKTSANSPTHEERISTLEVKVDALEKGEDKPKLKTEKRQAKVGERILITNAKATFGSYNNGDILTVKEMFDDGMTIGVKVEREDTPHIFHSEYEVIIEESPQKTYDKPAQVGDTIRINEKAYGTDGKYKEGDILTVKKLKNWGDIPGVYVEEFVRPFVSMKEFEIIGRESEPADPRDAFKNGDKVRLLSGGDKYPLRDYYDGEIYEVRDVKSNHSNGKRIAIRGGEQWAGYALPSQLEIVEEPALKVGDYAKVIGKTYHDDIRGGVYVKITSEADHVGDYRIDLIDGSDYDFAQPEALEKVELTDEDLTFMKIGRQPGEFKKGDIVYYEDSKWFENSGIGEVIDMSTVTGNPCVKAKQADGEENYFYLPSRNVKLIAPAEARVDKDA